VGDLDKRFKARCPRQLKALPDTWCPLAVLRLKTIKALGREPTEDEEARMPGCPWAIAHQLSGYCWFKYEAHFMYDSPSSDLDIAALLQISVDTVKKTSEKSIAKLQDKTSVAELKSLFNDESVIEDSSISDDSIYCE
jgi:hypothetical protein